MSSTSEKAALHGVSETISQTLSLAVGGLGADSFHDPREKEDVEIVLQLPRNCARTRSSCSP
ncbi:MAG: hypothetical protein R3F11_26475 [Verrucomicrobiales bacterium]